MHQTKILPPAPRIRVTALGLMQRPDGRILVERGEDRSKNQIFYRALGGGVEFGEHAAQALEREFMEELGIAVTVNQLHRVIENIFEYEGRDGHEIIFVYGVVPQDNAFYAVENPPRVDTPPTAFAGVSLTRLRRRSARSIRLALASWSRIKGRATSSPRIYQGLLSSSTPSAPAGFPFWNPPELQAEKRSLHHRPALSVAGRKMCSLNGETLQAHVLCCAAVSSGCQKPVRWPFRRWLSACGWV